MAITIKNMFIVIGILNHVLMKSESKLATLSPLKIVPQPVSCKPAKSIGFKEYTDNNYCTYFLPYDLEHFKTSILSHSFTEKVIFEEASLGNEGVLLLGAMLNLTNQLDLLSLNQNDIGSDGGAEIFRSIMTLGNKSPKALSLERNNIRDGGLRALPGMARRHGDWCIEELNLRSNMIGSAGMRSLASAFSSIKNNTLQRLYLGGNPIGDDGVAALCIAFMTGTSSQLTVLDLSDCALGDRAVHALMDALPSLPHLKHLDLGRNSISSKGIAELCRGLKTSAIETIDVRVNCIGDIGAGSLGKLLSVSDTLTSVHMGWNGVGPRGVERFVRGMKSQLKTSVKNTGSPRGLPVHVDLSGNRIDFNRPKTAFAKLSKLSSSHTARTSRSPSGIQRSGAELLARLMRSRSPNSRPLSLSLCGCGLNERGLTQLRRQCQNNVDLTLN